MFALEIDFHDGISSPETILVRRSNAIIGSSDMAHVVIEGASSSVCEVRVLKGLGRNFHCSPIRRSGTMTGAVPFPEQSFEGFAELRLGDITARLTSLDIDLSPHEGESADEAGLRTLREALSEPSPKFPAIAVLGPVPSFVSFPPDSSVTVGRTRKVAIRLDASDVSSEHARFGFEGEKFWVEDLGSTNGTFIGSERIAGRRFLEPGDGVRIGVEFTLVPVTNEADIAALGELRVKSSEGTKEKLSNSYPSVVAVSSLVRPKQFSLGNGRKITIGRDPANDIWIGASHISRHHVEVLWKEPNSLVLTDLSSNGTFVDGSRLAYGEALTLEKGRVEIDLCSGILLSICFSPEEELEFLQYQQEGEAKAIKPEAIDGETQAKGLPVISDSESAAISSSYGDSDFGTFRDDVAITPVGSSAFGENRDVRSYSTEEANEISRIDDRGAGFETDYERLSDLERGEEYLDPPTVGGFRRILSMLIVIGLVLFILMLFIGVFAGDFLLY